MSHPSGERLKQAREAAGFAHASDATRHFRWTSSTYNSHENGQTPVPVKAAERYAEAYGATARGVTAAWILTGEGDGPARDGPPINHAAVMTQECEPVDIAALDGERALLPAVDGTRLQVWRIVADTMAAAQYNRGDFVIVDTQKPPEARNVVLAKAGRRHMVREFYPNHIFGAALPGHPPVETITVDNVSVTIHGVVIGKITPLTT